MGQSWTFKNSQKALTISAACREVKRSGGRRQERGGKRTQPAAGSDTGEVAAAAWLSRVRALGQAWTAAKSGPQCSQRPSGFTDKKNKAQGS